MDFKCSYDRDMVESKGSQLKQYRIQHTDNKAKFKCFPRKGENQMDWTKGQKQAPA